MTSQPTASRTHPSPPGPSQALTVEAVRQEPLQFILDLTAVYGDMVRYYVGDWPCTIVNQPAYVKHVLQDNHANYTKIGTPDLMMLKPMLGEGLLTSDGPVWLRQRRITQPAFHRQRLTIFGQLMTDMTLDMLRDWAALADSGQTVAVDTAMTQLTLRIVARALFSYHVEGEADRFGKAVEVLNECMGHADPTNQAVFRRFPQALGVIHTIVKEIIWSRRLLGQREDDLLDMLMNTTEPETGERLTSRQLLDQVVTLLLAGHETTAKALTWTFYLLDQHREAEARLQAEVDDVLQGRAPTVDDLPNLPYTWMVLQESMRLRPPIWLLSRIAVADDVIGGYHIPAGSLVVISPYALHRHPAYWEYPEAFHPEHFSQEQEAERPGYAYVPFSGGPRLCVGKPFAIMETRLVLATVAQHYQLRLLPGHPVTPEALVTLRPRYGMPMTVEARPV